MLKKRKIKKMNEDTARRVYGWCQYVARDKYVQNPAFGPDDLVTIAFIEVLKIYAYYDPSQGELSTYVMPRIEGAIKDYLRNYLRQRITGEPYKDHKTKRFVDLESVFFPLSDNNGSVVGLPEGIPCKTRGSDVLVEVKEELQKWKKENYITRMQWLVLIYRFGYELPQDVIGSLVGLCESRISQIESNLRDRFENLPCLERQNVDLQWKDRNVYKKGRRRKKRKK